jgi:hypothetical protein
LDVGLPPNPLGDIAADWFAGAELLRLIVKPRTQATAKLG